MTLEAKLMLDLAPFRLDCRCTLPTRGVTALFGRSGSGKTTFLRCIAGLEPQARGTVRFGESTWQDETRFVPAHRRGVGLVFQEPTLFTHLSVRGNLMFALARAPSSQPPPELDATARHLGISALLERDSSSLSRGEAQRVAIARALLSAPQLLLLDEPLASLDADSKADVLPYLDTLHRDLAVPMIYVTHSLSEVTRLADTLVLIDQGRVIATGPLGDMLTRLDLPLCRRDDACAVLAGTIARHEPDDHLSIFSFDGGELSVTLHTVPVGTRTRVKILARDVSLAVQPPTPSSILNVITGQIIEIAPLAQSGHALVKLRAGREHLIARVTQRSVMKLGLTPGLTVYAQMKSAAL